MGRTVKYSKHMASGQPQKPTTLSARASAEWDRLLQELADSNIVVSPAHRSLLSLAATIAADIGDAWKAVDRDGAYIESKTGLIAHPASKRLDALRRDRIKVLTLLGLRTAIPTEPPSKDPTLEDMVGGQ